MFVKLIYSTLPFTTQVQENQQHIYCLDFIYISVNLKRWMYYCYPHFTDTSQVIVRDHTATVRGRTDDCIEPGFRINAPSTALFIFLTFYKLYLYVLRVGRHVSQLACGEKASIICGNWVSSSTMWVVRSYGNVTYWASSSAPGYAS